MTETSKVASLASDKPAEVKRPRAPRNRKSSAKPAAAPNSAAQSANAQKRWVGVEPEVRSENMRAIAQKRWAADEIADAETKQYFESEDLDTAMETYQRMRQSYEMVGKILDRRFQAERQAEEKCSNPACGKPFNRDRPWYYRNTVRNPITNAPYNEFACSQACMIAIKAVGTQKRA